MKRLAFLFLVALASAALTYFVVGLRRPPDHLAQIRGTDLQWLQVEFDLTDEQLAAVRELHDEYSGRCAQHCADIMAARAHLATLPAGPSADRVAGERRVVELEAICNDATRVHLRRVAGCMPPVQGERFLRTVEPHLAQLPHDGARGLGR